MMKRKYATIIFAMFLSCFLIFFSACKSFFNITVQNNDNRWDEGISKRFKDVSRQLAEKKGCRACHKKIEIISQIMQPYLLAAADGKDGYECTVCHGGNPGATTKHGAHRNLYPNPSSMWAMAEGNGCVKCHSREGSLKTVMGKSFKKPTGGSMMDICSDLSDPSCSTGTNHVYRLQRSLMALETGKASKTLSSNGVIEKGTFPFSNFDMDDPDGTVPNAGSKIYRAWIKKAVKSGLIEVLENVRHIPTFEEGLRLWKNPANAGFSDMYRKQCGRCHVWGEGRDKRGDYRAGGCAACHVLYNNDGLYEGSDKIIPKNRAGHLMLHQITTAIPAQQCNHCHTRGKRIGTTYNGMFEYDYVGSGKAPPWDEHFQPQKKLYTKEYLHVRKDVHAERGMDCADCHTSIDVHGDGNIYPVTFYQVEIACSDCHGIPDAYPWELPVGYGTPVLLDGARGTYLSNGTEYLVTNRGNACSAWVRKGNRAFVRGKHSGKNHEIPLLKTFKQKDHWKTRQGKVAMSIITQHNKKMECYACHSTWAPQCFGCHIQYDMRRQGTDWVLSSINHDKGGRQVKIKYAGNIKYENRGFLRWETPILGVNYKGNISPLVPGCQVVWTFIDKKGKAWEINKIRKTTDGYNAPTLAPLQPHANTLVARTCEDCHVNPKALGYGTGKSRSSYILEGNTPLFQNEAVGIQADIASSKKKQLQVGKILNFPYAWDQLVTRSGIQIQNMPLLKDRPLNDNERNKTEREGLCVACHQYYGTEMWIKIRMKMKATLNIKGRALTMQEHDKALEKLIKYFIQ